MLSLAWKGISSFSARPLRMISLAGLLVSGFAFLFATAAVIARCSGATVGGWTSLIVVVTLLGDIQPLALGLIGKYIGKIFSEVKDRPRYFVDRKVGGFDE